MTYLFLKKNVTLFTCLLLRNYFGGSCLFGDKEIHNPVKLSWLVPHSQEQHSWALMCLQLHIMFSKVLLHLTRGTE